MTTSFHPQLRASPSTSPHKSLPLSKASQMPEAIIQVFISRPCVALFFLVALPPRTIPWRPQISTRWTRPRGAQPVYLSSREIGWVWGRPQPPLQSLPLVVTLGWFMAPHKRPPGCWSVRCVCVCVCVCVCGCVCLCVCVSEMQLVRALWKEN